MKPVDFPESNITLNKPAGMTDEEYAGLPVHKGSDQIISKWKLSFWEKLKVLISGHVWLSVLSQSTQPPVYISTDNPFGGPE